MEVAKLVLGYLKALAWPIVIIIVLLKFSPELKTFISEAKEIRGPAGTSMSKGSPEAAPGKEKSPDVVFSIRDTPAGPACVDRAAEALRASGFQNVVTGETTYGYLDGMVGAVWCNAPNHSVLITVAGPLEKISGKQNELYSAFNRLTR